ncbi:hypothetical protein GCM10017771_23950 [Streptomyces capitiformicae]|uniref:Uncharacterized protein n=1 Tax=Streptomyces capitiformicae TaxID=2014920 RepID=A0A919L789_9ACTN|nr:hypothetical protein GCM10017771_23950 [Streptomyces capitiformicae]
MYTGFAAAAGVDFCSFDARSGLLIPPILPDPPTPTATTPQPQRRAARKPRQRGGRKTAEGAVPVRHARRVERPREPQPINPEQ